MDRKTLLKDIGYKLRQIREPLKYSQREMAGYMDAYTSSYSRHEKGETFPSIPSLYMLAANLDISLDWLICGKGTILYKEKEQAIERSNEVQAKTAETAEIKTASSALQEDINELLDYMERIPQIRYEVLVLFFKLKKAHQKGDI